MDTAKEPNIGTVITIPVIQRTFPVNIQAITGDRIIRVNTSNTRLNFKGFIYFIFKYLVQLGLLSVYNVVL